MKTKRTQVTPTINQLWDEMQVFIDAAYRDGSGTNNPEPLLKDYAKDQSWTDALGRLLDAETANERRHRTGRPQGWKAPLSNVDRCKAHPARKLRRRLRSERDVSRNHFPAMASHRRRDVRRGLSLPWESEHL